MPPDLALLSALIWLELPLSRTNFHGPKDVRAIEVSLYLAVTFFGGWAKSANNINPQNYMQLNEAQTDEYLRYFLYYP